MDANPLVFLVRGLSLKPRPILLPSVQFNASPIWKRKPPSTIASPVNESNELSDALLQSPNRSIITNMSPSSHTSSDRDSMSLQSTSSGSNPGSLSNRNSSNSMELNPQPTLLVEHQPILQGQERLSSIRIDETYRRRCYRAGLNIFNK